MALLLKNFLHYQSCQLLRCVSKAIIVLGNPTNKTRVHINHNVKLYFFTEQWKPSKQFQKSVEILFALLKSEFSMRFSCNGMWHQMDPLSNLGFSSLTEPPIHPPIFRGSMSSRRKERSNVSSEIWPVWQSTDSTQGEVVVLNVMILYLDTWRHVD